MRIFVGVDPSISNTGVVLLAEDGRLVATVNASDYELAGTSTDGLSNIELYGHTAEAIAAGIAAHLPEDEDNAVFAVYEDYAFDACNRSFSLGEFGGILKYRLAQAFGDALHLRYAAPMRVKKFATGSGGAGKGSMKEQAKLECPELAGQTSDVCDAYFMAKLAMYLNDEHAALAMDRGNKFLRGRLALAQDIRRGGRD